MAFLVKVTNDLGQTIYGKLSQENADEIKFIKTLKNHESKNRRRGVLLYWNKKYEIPSTLSPVEKRVGVLWCLVVHYMKRICVKRPSAILPNEYLIAEMFSDTNFGVTPKCKIEIE